MQPLLLQVEHGTTLGDKDRNTKDDKLWERLQRKVEKLNNLEEETRRIMSKEGGADGLTDGQRNQTVSLLRRREFPPFLACSLPPPLVSPLGP